MPTYYALTTHGSHWFALNVIAHTRAEAEELARTLIGPTRTDYGTDISLDTEHKNLRIVPKSALRHYGLREEQVLEDIDTMNIEEYIVAKAQSEQDALRADGDEEDW